MELQEYATALGKILANLQSLEFAVRAFLYERGDLPHQPLPSGTDLHDLKVGDTVPENALTSYDSLGQLVDRYNRAVNDLQLAVDRSVVDLRDALAHGRVSAPLTAPNLSLLKFERPKAGSTKVAYYQELSPQWLSEQVKRVFGELQKVAKAGGAQFT